MKEAAEKEQAWLRQKYQEQQQQIEAQHRSIQENIVQLREKLEREREDVLREQTRILEHKMKVSLATASVVACPQGDCPGKSGRNGCKLKQN